MNDWLARALCADVDEDLWFPADGQPTRGVYERARLVCDRCPVSDECGQHAVDHNIVYGMWGGMSPKERRHLAPRGR